jgi:hypothetical protein
LLPAGAVGLDHPDEHAQPLARAAYVNEQTSQLVLFRIPRLAFPAKDFALDQPSGPR